MRASALMASIAGVTIALAGCSDPKAASEANFRKAVEPLVRDRFCRTVDVDRMQLDDADTVAAWPVIVPVEPFPSYEPDRKAKRAALEQSVAEGLLGSEVRTVSAKRVSYDEPLSSREVIVYTPTDKGREIFRPIERRTMSGMRPFPGVCAARGEVVDIVRWTDPSDMFGRTLTEVTYTYRGTDLASLVPQDQRAEFEQPKEAKVTLIRANDGWQPATRR